MLNSCPSTSQDPIAKFLKNRNYLQINLKKKRKVSKSLIPFVKKMLTLDIKGFITEAAALNIKMIGQGNRKHILTSHSKKISFYWLKKPTLGLTLLP